MTDKPCVFNLFCNLRVFIKERVTNPTPKTLVWDPTPRFSILGVGRAKSRKIDTKVGVGPTGGRLPLLTP